MATFHHRDPGLVGLLGRTQRPPGANTRAETVACAASSSDKDSDNRPTSPISLVSMGGQSYVAGGDASVMGPPRRFYDGGSSDEDEAEDNATVSTKIQIASRAMRPLDRPYFSIIADGIHCHPFAMNIARSAHPGGMVLVSDAMSAMGLGPGTCVCGSRLQSMLREGRA